MNNEVLEQLKQEYNETFKRMQDLGEIIANCADIDTNHCGQDVRQLHFDPNESQPVDLPHGYKDLLGMEVVAICGSQTKCEGCARGNTDCVKVELVGGGYICLAKPQQEESITELDDSPKSWEDVYRENMELLRRHSIEQSEANQRLLKALKEQSEGLKRPVISFCEENEEGLGDIIARIKEDTQAFMDYLGDLIKEEEQ